MQIKIKSLVSLNKKNCVTFNKELVSYFSIIPKSSGYNYGTDSSLEKKYQLAITENLNRFVSTDLFVLFCSILIDRSK